MTNAKNRLFFEKKADSNSLEERVSAITGILTATKNLYKESEEVYDRELTKTLSWIQKKIKNEQCSVKAKIFPHFDHV